MIVHILNTITAADTVTVVTHRVATSWPWYIIRAAGFISAGLLVLLMLSGIGQVTGIIYRWIEPIKVWAIHKAIALALVVAIIIHVSFLLIDHFVPFNIVQILVPFASHYNNGTKLLGIPLGGIAVTLGILAMYCVFILVLTSLGWIDTHKKTWRKLHYLSYVVAGFVLVHALYVGTDLKYGLFRESWIALGGLVFIAVIARLWRADTVPKNSKDE